MADIRFQILINGQPVCIAGADSIGHFSAELDWIKRSPESYEKAKAESPEPWDMSVQEWTRERLTLGARTSICSSGLQVRHWLWEELKVGDKVTIRILGRGETDEPIDQVG